MALALLKFPFKILIKKKVVHSARALIFVGFGRGHGSQPYPQFYWRV